MNIFNNTNILKLFYFLIKNNINYLKIFKYI